MPLGDLTSAAYAISLDRLAPRIARSNRDRQHTLLYLRFRGVDHAFESELRRSLEHVASRLWGPATVACVNADEYVLFLECWSVERGLQLAALLDRALTQGFRRLGADVRMHACTVPARSDADVEDLLAAAVTSMRRRAVSSHDTTTAVLLVEDDAAVEDATRMMLESFGYRVQSAADCTQALDRVRCGFRPDIIVTDYRLPGDDGLEVVNRVRRAVAREVPAIVITGDTSSRTIHATRAQGVHVLRKPMAIACFIDLIEQSVGVQPRRDGTA